MNRDRESRLARSTRPSAVPGAHHVRCPCDECGLERELDAAFQRHGMVASAVQVESGRATVEEVDE